MRANSACPSDSSASANVRATWRRSTRAHSCSRCSPTRRRRGRSGPRVGAAGSVASWYLASLAVAATGLIPGAHLFDRLPTRGVLYARALGLLLTTWLAWTAARFGLVPWGTPLVALALGLAAGLGAALAWRRPEAIRALRAQGLTLLAGEVTFLALFVLLALMRMQAPAASGTEKPMDLMLITAVHQATTMPPPDPWLAGYDVSYYHLGHVGADVLARLAHQQPGVAFNLVTASTGATAAVAVAGLAVDLAALAGLRRRIARWTAGGVAIVSLLLVAPLVGLASVAGAHGVARDAIAKLGVEGVPPPAGTAGFVPDTFWWWWRTTRVLPRTITEYPAFTLLLGDPHAHLLGMPLAVLVLALAAQVFAGGRPLTWRGWLHDPARLLLTALLFAGVVMTNAWDVVTLGMVWAAAALLAAARAGWRPPASLMLIARWGAIPAGVALALAWPLLGRLDPPPTSLALITGEHSDSVRWLAFWLAPALPAAAALLLLRPRFDRRAASFAGGAAALAVTGWAIGAGGRPSGELAARGNGWLVLAGLVCVIALLAGWARAADEARDRGLSSALLLAGAATALVFLTELVRVDDSFGNRLNTVFKIWLVAWVALATSAGALAGIAADRIEAAAWRSWRAGLAAACALVAAASTLTPLAMAVSRTQEGQKPGLDATAYLEAEQPGIRPAAAWVRTTLDPRHAVVLQSAGDSYSEGNQLSVLSGVPTLLGWPGHERQWRGDAPTAARRDEVEAVYAGAGDPGEAARAAGVTHVYVGTLERDEYGFGVTARFAGWRVAYRDEYGTIFEVPEGAR
ncbi:MAG: hypothetical protein EPO16_05405 [Dehalococcoidia bacterium]|nr:MAG: hypothetical protein EPO16_05405 [Dehalococcoidia bacterium]